MVGRIVSSRDYNLSFREIKQGRLKIGERREVVQGDGENLGRRQVFFSGIEINFEKDVTFWRDKQMSTQIVNSAHPLLKVKWQDKGVKLFKFLKL